MEEKIREAIKLIENARYIIPTDHGEGFLIAATLELYKALELYTKLQEENTRLKESSGWCKQDYD